jgi:putative heme transporter
MISPDTTATLPLADLDALRVGDLKAWRERLRKFAVPGLAAAAALAVLLTLRGPGRTFADALERAVNADPRWVLGALAFELLSFGGYALLLWHVAGRDAPRFDLRTSAQVTLAGTAASRVLPTAGAGGAALTLWTLRRAGRDGRESARTLLTFLVLVYAVFLTSILVAGTLVATGVGSVSPHPLLAGLPAALAGAAIVGALLIGARPPRPAAPGARLARVRDGAAVLSEAVREALVLARGGDVRLLGAVAWWGFDIAVLWAMLAAFGVHLPIAVLVLAYFVGQVANTLPIPGSVSGGTVGVLLALGAPGGVALAAVLAYRAVAIWTPGLAGLAALTRLRSTLARWSAEDAGGRVVDLPARELRPVPKAVAA